MSAYEKSDGVIKQGRECGGESQVINSLYGGPGEERKKLIRGENKNSFIHSNDKWKIEPK